MPQETIDLISKLQEDARELEKGAVASLGDVHDPTLGTVLPDGRTLRQAMMEAIDFYNEHLQQLLWTKWSQDIPRSEAKTLLAGLQAARASFMAYISDLKDYQLNTKGDRRGTIDPSGGATGLDVVTEVHEEERKTMALINHVLHNSK